MNTTSRLHLLRGGNRVHWPTLALSLALVAPAAWAADDEKEPEGGSTPAATAQPDWSVPVPGWKPVQANEHPRLIFRKDDVARLRERAKTEEGQEIMKRLDALLSGPFTTWSAAGWAFRYQMTGAQADADQAKACIAKMVAGTGNPDGRYHFMKPNGQLRAGPALSAMALAYDMAYDGLDEATRKQAIEAIQAHGSFDAIVASPRHAPGCNHFGAHQGGCATAILALLGDTGVDEGKLKSALETLLPRIRQELTVGFSERGFYSEGHQCGRISSTGMLPFLISYRNAAGRDLMAKKPNAQFIRFGWTWDVVRSGKGVAHPQRGMYARNFPRGGQRSETLDFAGAFGVMPAEFRPAWLWMYNHVVSPDPAKRDYDVLLYPDTAAYAMAFWPIGEAERNPGDYLPKVFHDPGMDYLVFRNGWTGTEQDLIVTVLMGRQPKWGRGMGQGGTIYIAGRGLQDGPNPWIGFPGMFHSSQLVHHRYAQDGSASISGVVIDGDVDGKNSGIKALAAKPTGFAVDFSRASGAELVAVQVGPQTGHQVEYWMKFSPMKGAPKAQALAGGAKAETVMGRCGGEPAAVFTLGKDVPAPKFDGSTITVGEQTFTWDGKTLTLKVIGPEVKPL